ncbi:MAG TPA: DUF4331 domain-containing protein [Streptosporangiaceae bacterium]|nr:DUF4331 domain-containing protein [Streptosporangiaceae bacterium]
MSSHREAPEISKDPVADSTDLYAFVSPDKPDTVTIIANYIPLQLPSGGPNFYEFGDDVLYQIHIDNNGDGQADISYQFRFTTTVRDPDTFLYNTGPITSLGDTTWNRVQTYDVAMVSGGSYSGLGTGLPCPPCNIGPLSTPDYAGLAADAVSSVGGITVFAGQRAEAFYVDLGAIFDLGDLRPLANAHAFGSLSAGPGVNATNNLNVNSIAIQVPISAVTISGHPVIGVWTTASRQKARVFDGDQGDYVNAGPWVQVSRLGNPLVNEVLIPMGSKDLWNTLPPDQDKRFLSYVTQPGLAALLNVLYPGAFPHLAAAVSAATARADLEAILLTGIPKGVINKTYTTYTGPVIADMLRLNTSIAPASTPKILGLLADDVAGFPNGRRPGDDVVTIELQAVAGATLPLVDKSFTPDAVVGSVTDFKPDPPAIGNPPTGSFPYLGTPYSGYDQPS